MQDIPNFFIKKEYDSSDAEGLSEKSLHSLSSTKAEHTIDAYESDWLDFCDWCRYHHEKSFPAGTAAIVNYINDLADYAKFATIRRRISAISENFNAAVTAGVIEENPCREWIVRETLVGLSRQKGGAQKGKTPLYWEDLEKIVKTMDLKNLRDVRDKAILLLGFMGAFRRSEISGLDVEDIRFLPQGAIVTVRQSKTDQTAEGQQVGIPYISNTSMCAVTALKAWLSKGGITSGPLFRNMNRKGEANARRLSDKSINLILKKYVQRIGLSPELYGAHSLRHGFATSAALHGVEERLIMKQTRHRSVDMVRRYINEASLFVNNPISAMFGRAAMPSAAKKKAL